MSNHEPSPTGPLDVAVITGSVRATGLGHAITRWFLGQVRQHGGFSVDVLGPSAPAAPGEITVAERLARAEGFVFVTPEYNRSYPAPLKQLIDDHPLPWRGKPAAFVSYGGISGGMLATEHLRGVLIELHCAPLRDAVVLPNVWDHFDDGELISPPGSEVAAKTLLTRLGWWGEALRAARARQPYDG